MDTSSSSFSNMQPLAAPPSISGGVRVMIPSVASQSLVKPSMVTPASEGRQPGAVKLCGDKEKVGRWSDTEHQVFLQGLETYGKQWKFIAGLIGTRTVVQVRTHAQKYFQKQERQGVVLPKPARVSKRKSLPPSLPSRKKSRKASSRLSLSLSSSQHELSEANLSSYPSYISKSSSSSSSENWSTVSPNGVMELIDVHNPIDKAALDEAQGAFDQLINDPLEWLIETETTQQYLPESSLPMFPDLGKDAVVSESETEVNMDVTPTPVSELLQQDVVQDAVSNMADPLVTVHSLLQPTNTAAL